MEIKIDCIYKVMRLFLIILAFVNTSAKAQCDYSNVYLFNGSDISGARLFDYCPRVSYTFDADTTENLYSGLVFRPMSQLPRGFAVIKSRVERQIQTYVSEEFYKKLSLQQVDIEYYDPAIDTATEKWNLLFGSNDCKAKYVLYYAFRFDSMFSYIFSLALDSAGKLISRLKIPSRSQFVKINTQPNICKIMEMARKAKPDLGNIESIGFDFDQKTKRFVWNVFPVLRNGKTGSNLLKYVQIDAADLKRVRILKAIVEIAPAIE